MITPKMGCDYSKDTKTKGTFKILMLGIGGSGKSTFGKQMKIIHGGGFSEQEIKNYKTILLCNILLDIRDLIKIADSNEYEIDGENRKHARFLNELIVFDADWTEAISEKVKLLWKDKAIQKAQNEPGYQHQLDYLMFHIDRIGGLDYVPTNDDILRARQRTTGVSISKFVNNKYIWEIVDVGGQKTERNKWEQIIDTVLKSIPNAVIFFVALDEYNVISVGEKSKTKMDVALDVWFEIISSPTLAKIPILLFLNKIDLFSAKIEDEKQFKSFKKMFRTYGGGRNVDNATGYIQKKFTSLAKHDKKLERITTHVTCALDTQGMAITFNAVSNYILKNHLSASGIDI